MIHTMALSIEDNLVVYLTKDRYGMARENRRAGEQESKLSLMKLSRLDTQMHQEEDI